MKGKICSLPYIDKIKDNVLGINLKELSDLYEDLKTYDIIIPVASGRSKHAMNIPLSQATAMKNPKIVISLEGPEFPWGSLYEAAPLLEERHKRILILFSSGSGETEDPRNTAYDIQRYIEERKTERFKVDAITSNPNSSIGKVAKRYGNLLELKGRGKREALNKKYDRYVKRGIMRDIFELGSSFLLQMFIEGLYKDLTVDEIYGLAEKEFQKIGEMVDRGINSAFYKSAIDNLETRCHVFRNSRGTGDEVVRMTLIRLEHVKQVLGDEVHITNPPRPRARDFQFSVSYSGATQSIVNSSKIFRKLGGYQFSIIGSKESELEANSNSSIILEEEVEPGQPRKFYMRAAFVASPLPIKLIERFEERGISLPESVLSYYHSVTG